MAQIIIITLLVLAFGWAVYRTFFKPGGGCGDCRHGCGGCGGSCDHGGEKEERRASSCSCHSSHREEK